MYWYCENCGTENEYDRKFGSKACRVCGSAAPEWVNQQPDQQQGADGIQKAIRKHLEELKQKQVSSKAASIPVTHCDRNGTTLRTQTLNIEYGKSGVARAEVIPGYHIIGSRKIDINVSESGIPSMDSIRFTYEPDDRRKKHIWKGCLIGIATIIVGVALGLFLLKYTTVFGITTGSKRLSFLQDRERRVLYASLFDFDKDGQDELITLCNGYYIEKNGEKEELLAFEITNEKTEYDNNVFCSVPQTPDTGLPWGIYFHDNKYYLGLPTNVAGWFVFYDAIDGYYDSELGRYVQEPVHLAITDIAIDEYELIEGFPFDDKTTDFSMFADSYETVLNRIRDEDKNDHESYKEVENDLDTEYETDWSEDEDEYFEVYATGNVYVRTGPGREYDSIGSLNKGDIAEYTGYSEMDSRAMLWYQIVFDGQYGWVSSKYTEMQ